MNQHTRAEEPSMDDILASIRKIIAEDGPKAPPQTGYGAAEPAPSEPVPVAGPEAPASLSARLNDAFGYAPGADTPRPLPSAVRFRTPVRTAIDDDLADILSDSPLPRNSPTPAAPSAPASPAPSSGMPAPSAPQPLRATDALRLPEAPASTPVPASKLAEQAPSASAAPIPPAASVAAQAPSTAAEPAKPAPIVIAAAPRVMPSVEAASPPRAPAPAQPAALSSLNGLAPPSSAPAAAPQKPAASAPVVLAAMPPIAKEKPAEPAHEAAPPPAAQKAPETAEVKDDATAAAASALGKLDAGLAAAIRAAANPEIVVSAVEVVPSAGGAPPPQGSSAGTLVAQQASPAPSTPAAGGESVFSKPSAFIDGVALTPIKSFDDSAAELLRPMLREWLDANMPRIVEKALKIEIAGTRQALPKPADAPSKPAAKS